MSEILRRGRLKSAKDEVVKFTSSIKDDEKLVKHVIDINKAHIVMLVEQKIIDSATGAEILKALKELEKGLKLRASHEDVHMAVEEEVTKATAPEVGGNLHIAKSRNDQVSAAIRMALREELIRMMTLLVDLQNKILELSEEHIETIIPGYTHLQPAQPVTFAHYLISFFDAFKRDLDRVYEAYERVDRCPMGAGALATTSFPINRERVSELLGFGDILENSLDAVSSRDFILEALTVLSILAVDVSRLVEDMIIWCTSEFRVIDLPDEYVSTSSIMPQKKNPEVFEVIRARTGHIIGELVASLAVMKGLSSTYNLDFQEVTPKLWNGLETMKSSLVMLSVLLPRVEVNRDIYTRPDLTFTTSTELANVLVRRFKIPFRTAHNIVGALVTDLVEEKQSLLDVTPEKLERSAERVAGISLKATMQDINSSVDPAKFIESHNARGGPSKYRVSRMIETRKVLLEGSRKQISQKKEELKNAKKALDRIVNSHLTSIDA